MAGIGSILVLLPNVEHARFSDGRISLGGLTSPTRNVVALDAGKAEDTGGSTAS